MKDDAECHRVAVSSRTCERGTDTCTVRHGHRPPELGEPVLFVLALGPRVGELRAARIVRERVDGKGVEWATLAIFTAGPADGVFYTACPLVADAPFNAAALPGTWHRPRTRVPV